MIATLLSAIALQTTPLMLADQEWKLNLNITGVFVTPIGNLENPILIGTISLKEIKSETSKHNNLRLQLSLNRVKNPTLEPLLSMLPDGTIEKQSAAAIFKDKENGYFIDSYSLDKKNLSIVPRESGGYSPSDQVLNPVSVAVGVAQRALNDPELRKEYFIREEGPRKYYVIFRPNLNADTSKTPGDVAYKFDLKLKDDEQEYPQFFSGAIRLNTKNRLVQYLTSTSDPSNQPTAPDDADLGGKKTYAIRIDQVPPKPVP